MSMIEVPKTRWGRGKSRPPAQKRANAPIKLVKQEARKAAPPPEKPRPSAGEPSLEQKARAVFEPTPETITRGNRIRALREAKKWTQAELAKRISISQQNLAAFELGRIKRPPSYVLELARVFNVTPEFIVTGRGSPKPQASAVASGQPPALDRPSVPVMYRAAAGSWEEQTPGQVPERFVGYYPHPDFMGYPQYGVDVDGPSMNVKFPDGSIAICIRYADLGMEPATGDYVHVVRVRDQLEEHSLKRLRITADAFELLPESHDPRFQEPLRFSRQDGGKQLDDSRTSVEIRGRAITCVMATAG